METRKLDWKVNSKIGSLDNVKHRPGGGTIKIFNERYGTSRSSSEARTSSTAARSPSPPTTTSGHTSRKASVDSPKVTSAQTPTKPKSTVGVHTSPPNKSTHQRTSSSVASTPSPATSSLSTSRPGSAKPPQKPIAISKPVPVETNQTITNGTSDLLGDVQSQLNQLILDQPIKSSVPPPQPDLLA